ncbi:MAG: penicillin-binding protein 2 [Campylobacter sputorum]|uniref:peptidoglycan D,D-transpeptidase FtsI family protein n=1 Tax=Campylobacter sputorum TaxID=206 RepID=UPI000B78C1DF|nr:penicillin-binding protein 2 [Campylobacter sputorum]ASM38706.1 cell division protein FtsI / penicillin-binding protein [Campylobacter sputorum bv. paraureolyticus LMG 11764]MDY6120642.1 penicillin-binding protein 2 [Campylobacter sputorum]
MIARQSKITIVFLLVLAAFLILLVVFFYRATLDRRIVGRIASDSDTSIRGDIISKDGFRVATTQKIFDVKIDTRSLNPDKKDLFIQLYSIYTDDNPNKIKKIINSKKGYVILSKNISAKTAAHLKELGRFFSTNSVFIPFVDDNGRKYDAQAMGIIEKGEYRVYMAQDSLTPSIGYVKEVIKNGIIKREGVKGIEKYYDDYLASIKDAQIVGSRDLSNNIIIEKPNDLGQRIDGYNVILNVSLKLQKMTEYILDTMIKDIEAREIVAGIMDSKTGEMLALATTNRYNPSNIKKENYRALNSTSSEYAYEPGSVIKPIVFAYLLSANKVNPLETINTHNGIYKHGKSTIRDSHPAKSMSAEEVIIHSSNIGMVELSKRISGEELYMNFIKFGFTKRSGIDLPYEQRGIIPSLSELNSEIYRGTASYGYGIQTTFLQLLRAYAVFNNNGYLVTPQLVSNLQKDGKLYKGRPIPPQEQILTEDVAKRIRNILIRVVKDGTGKKADIDGLNIGGKTGTSRIAVGGGYSKSLYNASFFGFADDKFGHNYTIGVFVREPKEGKIYASQSAIPIFKSIVELLIQEQQLIPSI